MVEQAQEARRRVLADMAQRRRAMTLQIEQFRAARDELAAAVLGLRDSVDVIVEDLSRADDAARAAAAEVARRQPSEPSTAELVAEIEEVEAALDVTRARAPEAARAQAPSTRGGRRGRHHRLRRRRGRTDLDRGDRVEEIAR